MNFTDFLLEREYAPEKMFIAGGSETLTYGALRTHISKLARYLRREIGENENILLLSNNSSFFIVAYLAIIQSGNICIPLDTQISESRLEYILQISKPSLVFVKNGTEILVHSLEIPVITPKEFEDILFREEAFFKTADDFSGSRIAQILFTSGSTAEPKGVMLTHENVIANTESISEYLNLTENDRMEVVLPFHYCYGLSLLHTHLRVGGSIVINNKFMMLNTVIEDLLNYNCTGFAGVPSHFQLLLRKSPRFFETDFPSLRYVTQAGGRLANSVIEEFTAHFPAVKFYTMYGQTEATARLSYLPPDKLVDKLGSIGRGIPGVTLKVLNEQKKQVEPGEVGEIVASGRNIMKGYYKDPDLTSKIIRDGRLHTGDMATIDDDGYIYFVGRDKRFLKVGGERISPKEIEDVIMELPEVIDCTVTGVADEVLGEAIVAQVVTDEIKSISYEYIMSYCKLKLGPVKTPKYFKFVSDFKLKSTGKKSPGLYNRSKRAAG